ncbi:flavodoxin family protein [Mycolicibacterium sp. 018/SC-01/001]|uniref:NAD(P)H-dependent oxidoreductase n=1 Tax=Mycolicibacterium sp. 018/SC-01/001 TaxID=2592069 RepID=UPI0011816432|nr:NAD(P)H-dependent oxidoreductase [Mycolicibacterium sp. 018/SC-01/001]TRW80287.1 flavodoxin family protein [Mycolicibacterium sp. 018/SC-01/001]
MAGGGEHTLVVVAHPDPTSLCHHVANAVAAAAAHSGSAEIADLAWEGFDPRWTAADRAAYQGTAPVPVDVVAEQVRVTKATHLVLVFPVYWWSMPALLKGWIDRVFVSGWAFGYTSAGDVEPALQWLTIHVLPVAASSAGVYDRHGYEKAMRAQIEHGLIDFCGAVRGAMAFIHDSEDLPDSTRAVAAAVDAIGAALSRSLPPDQKALR